MPLPCSRQTHVLAGMVILQDAYAHPLISGNFPEFRDVNIIQIIHAHRLLVCLVIRDIYHFNGHSCIPQLLDGLVSQTAPFCTPEFNADGKLFK